MSELIEIMLNGEARDVPAGLNLQSLLEMLELHPRTIVVEQNGQIIPRDRYGDTQVAAGDSVELVHFVGGGK